MRVLHFVKWLFAIVLGAVAVIGGPVLALKGLHVAFGDVVFIIGICITAPMAIGLALYIPIRIAWELSEPKKEKENQ